jgi:ferredoxin--NADP+ reductase
VTRDGIPVEGLYVTGWLKRGPTGIIGTNRADSIETVRQLLNDPSAGRLVSRQRRETLLDQLAREGANVVTLQDWLGIDMVERARGQPVGKPREKFTRVAEMLDIVGAHRRRGR